MSKFWRYTDLVPKKELPVEGTLEYDFYYFTKYHRGDATRIDFCEETETIILHVTKREYRQLSKQQWFREGWGYPRSGGQGTVTVKPVLISQKKSRKDK